MRDMLEGMAFGAVIMVMVISFIILMIPDHKPSTRIIILSHMDTIIPDPPDSWKILREQDFSDRFWH